MPGDEFVDGLDEEAYVLCLDVDDSQSILLLKPARCGLGNLAIVVGALGGALLEYGVVRFVDALDDGLGQAERNHGIHRLEVHDRIGQGEVPATV